MNFTPVDHIISVSRHNNGACMETKVVTYKCRFYEHDKKELIRIIRSRNKSDAWNLYFHKYDSSLSDSFEKDYFESKAYDVAKDIKGTLRGLLNDIDMGLFV